MTGATIETTSEQTQPAGHGLLERGVIHRAAPRRPLLRYHGGKWRLAPWILTDNQHRELAEVLASLRGAVVVSGYRCPLYDELFDGWQRIDVAAHADGARDRVESLWLSRGCPQAGLFDTHNVRAEPDPTAPTN